MSTPSKRKFQLTFLKEQKQVLSKGDNSVLYMNSSTMKILKYNKGSLVLVLTEQGQLLFKCMPSISVECSAIMLPSPNFFQDYFGYVHCDFYDSHLYPCDMVVLNCDNHKLFMKNSSFKENLKAELDHIFIREGLRFHLNYLGSPCFFTIKKIYSDFTVENQFQDSFEEMCANVSTLNISDDNSILENSVFDKSALFCSTPISKTSGNYNRIFNQEKKQINKFYVMHSNTKIVIKKSMQVKTCSYEILLKHIGGLKNQIMEIQNSVLALLNPDSVEAIHKCGIVLVGASGTGKTAVVQAISNEYHIPIINLNNEISDSNEAEYNCYLQEIYNEIIESSPCIFFLDGIDNFHRNRIDPYVHEEKDFICLSTFICDILQKLKHKVVIIGTAHDISAVHPSLRKPGTLEREIYFEIPSINDRKEILKKILDQKQHNLTEEDITEISEKSHGFTGGDLKHLCDKADVLSIEAFITIKDLREALKNVKPNSMTEFMFEVPNVKWNDIGGMHDVKTAITEMVDWPLKYAEQFKRFSITHSRGILLYGPPGCSKTMIAKALVSESHLNFISIKGPQFFNKYVGESEKAVSDLFKKARSATPCVLFFDEIDSLAPIRGSTSGNSNVSERILTQLLVEIDGIDVLQGVSIIAATNRPDMIDPSFLRPGRFDQMIYVPLPDYATRKEIFETKLKNIPHASDIDVLYLAEITEGYTGAEIAEICHQAAMFAIKEYLTSSSSVVTMLNFFNAVKSVTPRTSKEMIQFYENYAKRTVR